MDTMSTASIDAKMEELLQLAGIDHRKDDLAAVTKLDLSGCGLSSLPISFPSVLPNLSILFLSQNKFKVLPAIVGQCKSLQMMAFKDNEMEAIDEDALQPQLRWLILTNNRLTELPPTIGRCKRLQKCMLAGNCLQTLPKEFGHCTNLELIRLSSNRLAQAPMELLQLPKLSWAAFSDNPFLNLQPAQPTLPIIEGVDELCAASPILGQGAGGITRKVEYAGQTVAVKSFHGDMTSDGLPDEEKRISSATSALEARCLIDVLGETPSGALVLEYLHGFAALAGPPSMESCSRDVYTNTVLLNESQATTMLEGLWDALTKLHAAGIMHGDFYAHNILVDSEDPCNVRLTDFGAAFFYNPSADYGPWLQRIELRAFGVLVEEVAALLPESADRAFWTDLAEQCRAAESSFENVQVWWKQRQLSELTASLDKELEL